MPPPLVLKLVDKPLNLTYSVVIEPIHKIELPLDVLSGLAVKDIAKIWHSAGLYVLKTNRPEVYMHFRCSMLPEEMQQYMGRPGLLQEAQQLISAGCRQPPVPEAELTVAELKVMSISLSRFSMGMCESELEA